MRWNWDFIRARKIELDRHSEPAPAEKSVTINGHARAIDGADLSDMEVAGRVRMLMRGQLDHGLVCELARDRIVYLADRLGEIEVGISEADLAAGAAAVVDNWMGGDKAWREWLTDSNFLESADWLKAVELSRAVLSSRGKTHEA